jgi:lysophospholipase
MQAAWIEGADGARLRTALLAPRGKPRGSVVLSTGRTECLEKYFETAAELAGRGFAVLLHDWRGQGLSARLLHDRLRGHAVGFNAFLDDYQRLLAAYADRLPRPWLMVGHSMGGCLNLMTLAKGETRFAAAVLLAPMLGLNLSAINRAASGPLSRLFDSLGRGGDYVLGQKGAPWATFEKNPLTHDPVRYARMYAQLQADPELNLGGPTWSWLASALEAMRWLARDADLGSISIPVTLLSAQADSIVDNAAQALAAGRLKQGRLVRVAGAYHEILQETDARRAVFFAEFDALAATVAA